MAAELCTYVSRVAISVPVGVVIVRLPPRVGFGYQCGDSGRPRLMARFPYEDPNQSRHVMRMAHYFYLGHQLGPCLDSQGE